MPSWGHEVDHRRISRGRAKWARKAAEKGIMRDSSGWHRFMESHRHKFYRDGA